MKQQNFTKGRAGEAIAAAYLKKHGFEVIEQNWRSKFGEIDIVATKNETLLFIEVKLKYGDKFGSPEEMLTKTKIQQVLNNAEVYLLAHRKFMCFKKRIDGICIVMEGEHVARITHYENISG